MPRVRAGPLSLRFEIGGRRSRRRSIIPRASIQLSLSEQRSKAWNVGRRVKGKANMEIMPTENENALSGPRPLEWTTVPHNALQRLESCACSCTTRTKHHSSCQDMNGKYFSFRYPYHQMPH